MSKVVAVGIFLLSLTSWPVATLLSKLNILKNERAVLLGGLVYFGVVLFTTIFLFRRNFRKVDPLMYGELLI